MITFVANDNEQNKFVFFRFCFGFIKQKVFIENKQQLIKIKILWQYLI